jgi:type II secretory pathway pseudopilin PulG
LKKQYKVLLILALVFAISFSSMGFAKVEEKTTKAKKEENVIEKTIRTSKGKDMKFKIHKNAQNKVSNKILKDLAEDYPDAASIDIIEVNDPGFPNEEGTTEYSTSMELEEVDSFTPQFYWYDIFPIPLVVTSTTLTRTQTDAIAADYFITSAAQGHTAHVSTTWTRTLSSSVSGSYYLSIGVSGSVTKTYSTSHDFDGPPEGSSYNSREFRERFYEHRGNYTQAALGLISGHVSNFSGTYEQASKSLMYSINHYIE